MNSAHPTEQPPINATLLQLSALEKWLLQGPWKTIEEDQEEEEEEVTGS